MITTAASCVLIAAIVAVSVLGCVALTRARRADIPRLVQLGLSGLSQLVRALR